MTFKIGDIVEIYKDNGPSMLKKGLVGRVTKPEATCDGNDNYVQIFFEKHPERKWVVERHKLRLYNVDWKKRVEG